MSGAAYRQHKQQTWDVDALMAETERAISSAEYARATWEEQVDNQRYVEWLRRRSEAIASRGVVESEIDETTDGGHRGSNKLPEEPRNVREDDEGHVGDIDNSLEDSQWLEEIALKGDRRKTVRGSRTSRIGAVTAGRCAAVNKSEVREAGGPLETSLGEDSEECTKGQQDSFYSYGWKEGFDNKHLNPDQEVNGTTEEKILTAASKPTAILGDSVRAVLPGPTIETSAALGKPGNGVYSTAEADEAYRAGLAALDGNQPARALALFQQAATKCPPDKRAAMTRIRSFVQEAKSLLVERKGIARKPVRSTHQMAISRGFHNPNGGASRSLGEPRAELATRDNDVGGLTFLGGKAGAGANIPDSNLSNDQEGACIRTAIMPDAQAADEAFRAGLAALEAGDARIAVELLKAAAYTCPPEKKAAAVKIQKLIGQAVAQLRG